MENTIYIGLSRLNALQTHMDLIANNIANANTPGYKANKVLFTEYLDKPKGMKDQMSMVLDYGDYRVKDNGPIKTTDNPLDVALEGPGYLGVQGADGKIYYTRAGNMALGTDGALVTQQGMPIVDTGGAPITLPPNSQISIDQQGNVSTKQGIVGQLMVQEFPNIQKLTPFGNNLYKTSEAGVQSEKTRVLQGAIEGSNTQPVLEMTDMMDVSRSYQSVARMLQNEHDRIRSTIKSLTSGQ